MKDDNQPKETLLLEGYRGINQWLTTAATDHLLYDRVMMPVIMGAPILAISGEHLKTFSSQIMVLVGGFFLLLFWIGRTERSNKRTYAAYKVLNEIEEKLEFSVRRRLKEKIDDSGTPKDFTLKRIFYFVAGFFYIVTFYIVLCTK